MSVEGVFLVIESDLKDRYASFVKKTNIKPLSLEFRSVYHKNKLFQLILRLLSIPVIYKKFLSIRALIANQNYIFLSNAEGYVAANVIKWIKKTNPNISIIALQHGLFPLANKDRKLLNLTNDFTGFFGFYIFGWGFGRKELVDRYVVYNKIYKEKLLKEGWHDSDVFISSYFLKDIKQDTEETRCSKDVVYFLQPLSKVGICSVSDEGKLNKLIIEHLLKHFDKVYIKQHPFARVEIQPHPKICELTEHNAELVNSVVNYYSCYSTALLDYDRGEVKCVAIKSSMINVDKNVYNFFRFILDLDDYERGVRVNQEYILDGGFYETGVDKIETIVYE